MFSKEDFLCKAALQWVCVAASLSGKECSDYVCSYLVFIIWRFIFFKHTSIAYLIFLEVHFFSLSRKLPKLPPWNPFFSLRNTEHVFQRMKGMQEFLEMWVALPLVLTEVVVVPFSSTSHPLKLLQLYLPKAKALVNLKAILLHAIFKCLFSLVWDCPSLL